MLNGLIHPRVQAKYKSGKLLASYAACNRGIERIFWYGTWSQYMVDKKKKYLSEDVIFKTYGFRVVAHRMIRMLERDVLRNSVAKIACQRGVEHKSSHLMHSIQCSA